MPTHGALVFSAAISSRQRMPDGSDNYNIASTSRVAFYTLSAMSALLAVPGSAHTRSDLLAGPGERRVELPV